MRLNITANSSFILGRGSVIAEWLYRALLHAGSKDPGVEVLVMLSTHNENELFT